MNDIYKIDNCVHFMHENQVYLKDENHYPLFQKELDEFKQKIIQFVENNQSKSFIHFGDGDYFFLTQKSVGSASIGKRALSKPYNMINMEPYNKGFMQNDYICVEIFEKGNITKLKELFNLDNKKIIPTEFLYGLTANKWFLTTFKGKIGLIGAKEKLDIIKELITYDEYKQYLGLNEFNDYISIPQKYACDDLNQTINVVRDQLSKSSLETKIFLCGIGHVKSGLMCELPKIKNAVYIDIGSGIDALAGIIDPERPFMYSWTNYRMKKYNYNNIDLLQYKFGDNEKLL